MRSQLPALSFGWLILCFQLASSLCAAPLEYDFASKDNGRWRALYFTGSGFEAGRGLHLRANDQGRLYSPPLDLRAEDYSVLSIVGSSETTRAKLFFATTGEEFREAASVRSYQEEGKLVFPLAANPHWKGRITALRIDFYQGDDEAYLTSMTLEKGLPPNHLPTPWRKPYTLPAGESTPAISRELPAPQEVVWEADTIAPLELLFSQYDILGNELSQGKIAVEAGKTLGKLPFMPLAALLKLAVSNPGKVEATFTMSFRQEPEAAPQLPTEPTCHLLNLPASTTGTTLWTPHLRLSPPTGRLLLTLHGNGTRTILADQLLVSPEPELPPVHLHFLPSGDYRLEASLDGVPCKMLQNARFRHQQDAPGGLPKAKTILTGARPAYRLDDEIIGTMDYELSDPPADDDAIRYANQMADIMPVSTIRLIFRFHDDGSPDFTELDNTLQSILLRHPRQAISVQVSVTDPGARWRENHPEEGIQDEKGEFRIKNYRDTPEATSSMASRLWLEDSKRMLRLLVKHLEEIPAGERVISILPCAGITWEWIHWGSARGVWVDYSPHFKRHFHDYLRERYQNDISILNHAWHSDHKEFHVVPLPTPEQRSAADDDLRPPASFQPQIDFSESISELISGNILALCQCIKEATHGRTLTGTYYGYANYILNGPRIHDGGHQRLMRLLNSPAVDILMAPSRYGTRDLGEVGGFMQPEASVRLHGKLLLSECDVRPVNADNALGRPSTLSGSRAIIQREFASQVAGRAAMRWFDFSRGWIAGDPRLLQLAASLARQDDDLRLKGGSLPDDSGFSCSVLTSSKTASMLARDSQLNSQLVEINYSRLLRSGLSCTFYDIEDLPAIADRHNLFVFLNVMRFDAPQQEALAKLVADPKNTLFFTQVSGILQNNTPETAWAESIFHCPFELMRGKAKRAMRFTPEAEKHFGINPEGTMQMRFACEPFLFPRESPNLLPLACTEDGRIALAMHQDKGATLFWCTLPLIPENLLRSVAIRQGLPVVETNPPAPVWLAPAILSVHTSRRPTEIILHNLPNLPSHWRQAPNETSLIFLE